MRRHHTLLFIIIVATLNIIPAQAHGYILRSIPEDRSTLQRPPTRLQYWFSEDLEPRFSEIHLRDQSGEIIATGGVDEHNRTLLTLQMPSELADGAYIVELRPAFASDGHVVAESRVFFVGEEIGGVEGQVADDTAIPLEVFWRTLLIMANTLIFGVSTLYSLVLFPAWGSTKYPAGGLPPRVMRRLRNTFLGAVGLAFVANIIALLQQSMVFFNASVTQVIQQNLWQVVQIGSRFGDVWNFRMVLLIFICVLIFVSHYYREMMPQLTRGIWNGLAWMGALLIGLSMVTSHAAGSLLLPWVAIIVNWLHALAVAFWVGGVMSLVLILPIALAPYEGEAKRQALITVMTRFSRIVALMVVIVIVTGVYNALNWFTSPADLNTSYGGSLAIKLVMVVLLLFVGGLHHLALRPHLATKIMPQFLHRLIDRSASFHTSLRLEVIVVIVTLGTVSLLSATPIPEPEFLQIEIETPSATQTVGDYTITSAIIPGGPGVNTYDTVVMQAGDSAQDVSVWVQLVNPTTANRGDWYITEQVEEGLYVAAGDDIESTGLWWTLVDVINAEGVMTRAAFSWDISDEATIRQSRDPQWIHFLVLISIISILLYIAYPTVKRLYLKLDVTPVIGFIAVGAGVGSMMLLIIGAQVINEQQRTYELTLNPLPEHINSVLPDSQSLQLGESFYTDHCLLWESQADDFRALHNILDDVRDEFLYALIDAGWRDLPPCDGDLSHEQRWHIVNYVRTFEDRNEGGS